MENKEEKDIRAIIQENGIEVIATLNINNHSYGLCEASLQTFINDQSVHFKVYSGQYGHLV